MSNSDRDLGPTLKRLRIAAGMTQEELAERAGISTRTVSDTERGMRTAVHHDTARRLATALALRDDQRPGFVALARGVHRRPLAGRAVGLPRAPTPLLGRADELDAVAAMLLDGGVRLLTLTGPGGIGKTRLAVEAARATSDSWPDGVFFVSLGEVQEHTLVATELARAIGAVESGPGLQEVLISRLGERRALLVLDTFEHLAAAVPLVYELSGPAPTPPSWSRVAALCGCAVSASSRFRRWRPPTTPARTATIRCQRLSAGRPRRCSGNVRGRFGRSFASTTRAHAS